MGHSIVELDQYPNERKGPWPAMKGTQNECCDRVIFFNILPIEFKFSTRKNPLRPIQRNSLTEQLNSFSKLFSD